MLARETTLMADLAFYATQVWFVFLLSVGVTAVIFPLVFLLSFAYDSLAQKYEKLNKVLLMLACTFVGVFVALLAIELYLEFTLPQLLSIPR